MWLLSLKQVSEALTGFEDFVDGFEADGRGNVLLILSPRGKL